MSIPSSTSYVSSLRALPLVSRVALGIVSAAVLASVTLSLGGCHRSEEADTRPDALRVAPAASNTPKPPVKFEAIESKALPPTLDVSGTLAADESSDVATQVAGVASKLLVDVGSKVKKGDPLVVLDARDAQFRAASANAAVEQARARLAIETGKKLDPESVPEVRSARQARDLAVADAERAQKMFESHAISQAEWDAVHSRAESARAQYDAAVVGVKATVAAVEAAAAQAAIASKGVADSTIRAPFDGAVVERRISTGEYANVGRVVAVVVRTNPLRLQFDVPESEVSRVEVGKAVQIRVAAFNDKLFIGSVKRIGASVKTTSRTMPVEAEFPNDDGTLKPGLFAQGELTLSGTPQPSLLVPLSSISSSGSNSRVFVKSGGKVVERLIKLGRQVGNKVEIFGAVTAQDEVATDNIDKLSDGLEFQP